MLTPVCLGVVAFLVIPFIHAAFCKTGETLTTKCAISDPRCLKCVYGGCELYEVQTGIGIYEIKDCFCDPGFRGELCDIGNFSFVFFWLMRLLLLPPSPQEMRKMWIVVDMESLTEVLILLAIG